MENIVWNIKSAIPVNIEVRSNIGGRVEQQDYACITSIDDILICTLCDGMGGMECGAMASKDAAEAIHTYLSCPPNHGVETPFEIPAALEKSFRYADQKVHMISKSSGTTAVTVVLQEGKVYWASIGDTRLYIFRKGELVQATRDHNYLLQLTQLYSDGYMSEEEYQDKLPMGHALVSYLGMGNAELFDLTELPLQACPKDILLLATDGLYNVVPCDYMKRVFEAEMPLKDKADQIMDHALDQAAKYVLDNTTFILIEI